MLSTNQRFDHVIEFATLPSTRLSGKHTHTGVQLLIFNIISSSSHSIRKSIKVMSRHRINNSLNGIFTFHTRTY